MIEEKNSFNNKNEESNNQYKDVNAMVNSNSKKEQFEGYSDTITNVMPGIDELFQKTTAIFMNGISKFAVLGFVPLLISLAVIALGLLGGGVVGISTNDLEKFIPVLIIVGIILIVIIIYISLLVQAATYLFIKDFSKSPSIKDLLKSAQKDVLPIFWINLIVSILVFFWSLLFIIPGLIMAVRYSMAIWVYYYEGLKGSAAINRSSELVKGYWWAVVGRMLVVYLLYMITTGVISYMLGLTGVESVNTIWDFVNSILSVLFGQYVMIYSCFVYWGLVKVKGKNSL